MNELVFEAQLMRIDGSVYCVQTLVCSSEEEAVTRASRCARNWSTPINLYQVPGIDHGDNVWHDHEVRFVAHIERDASPRMVPATIEAEQRVALHTRAVEAVRNLLGGAARLSQRARTPTSKRATISRSA